jgi:hypothetical protein
MSNADLIKKARDRAAQCRRLAGYVTDDHTKRVLLQMADEAEADIRTFEDRSSEQDNDSREA